MNAANEEGVSVFSPAEKLAIRAVLDGASFGDAANSTGLPVDQVERICTRYHNGLAAAMKQGAIQFIANSLDDSPAPRPWDMMDDIKERLGLRHPDLIPKNEADRPRVEALIAKRKGEPSRAGTAKPKAPVTPGAAAKQQPAAAEDGITVEKNPDGTFNVFDEGVLMESNVPEAELEAVLKKLRDPWTLANAEATRAISAAKNTLNKPLPEAKSDELAFAMEGLVEEMLAMPPEHRRPWIDQQIEDWLAPIREKQEADWLASQLSEEPTTGIEQHDSTPDGVRPPAMDSPPRDMIDDILSELGIPRWEDIPETEADRIRMETKKQQRQEALMRNPQT